MALSSHWTDPFFCLIRANWKSASSLRRSRYIQAKTFTWNAPLKIERVSVSTVSAVRHPRSGRFEQLAEQPVARRLDMQHSDAVHGSEAPNQGQPLLPELSIVLTLILWARSAVVKELSMVLKPRAGPAVVEELSVVLKLFCAMQQFLFAPIYSKCIHVQLCWFCPSIYTS